MRVQVRGSLVNAANYVISLPFGYICIKLQLKILKCYGKT